MLLGKGEAACFYALCKLTGCPWFCELSTEYITINGPVSMMVYRSYTYAYRSNAVYIPQLLYWE